MEELNPKEKYDKRFYNGMLAVGSLFTALGLGTGYAGYEVASQLEFLPNNDFTGYALLSFLSFSAGMISFATAKMEKNKMKDLSSKLNLGER